jgi:enolase
LELRDGEFGRYEGKGVRRAVENVGEIATVLAGQRADDLRVLDEQLVEFDGTPDKSRLGANALLGVSCAVARGLAESNRVPLWRLLRTQFSVAAPATIPSPMVNILSGGLHAGHNIEFQDFLIGCHEFRSLSDALVGVTAVHRATRRILEERGIAVTGIADEGGWGPPLPSNEAAIEILEAAIERANEKFSIALDVAASHFSKDGRYHLRTEQLDLSSAEMADKLADWCGKYPIYSIEDGLEQEDWEGWGMLTAALGNRVQLVGDDLFVTNRQRLERGIQAGVANAVLVKMNQIGTLSETFEVIGMAREAGYAAVISARSGETEDSFLADLAVASGAGQIKIGSITRSERLAKYNRLLEIEADEGLPYAQLTLR